MALGNALQVTVETTSRRITASNTGVLKRGDKQVPVELTFTTASTAARLAVGASIRLGFKRAGSFTSALLASVTTWTRGATDSDPYTGTLDLNGQRLNEEIANSGSLSCYAEVAWSEDTERFSSAFTSVPIANDVNRETDATPTPDPAFADNVAEVLVAGDNVTITQNQETGEITISATGGGSGTVTIDDVSGLQAALDGKAATSHTHSIADVSGLQTSLNGKAGITTEAAAYAALRATAGDSVDASTLAAVDELITAGKEDGWWDELEWVSVFLGRTVAGQSVVLKTPSGVPTSITMTGFTDADCADQRQGFGPGQGNNSKYASTGFIPSAHGLSQTNLSFFVSYTSEYTGKALGDFGFPVALNGRNAGVDSTYLMADITNFGLANNTGIDFGVAVSRGLKVANYSASGRSFWLDGSACNAPTSAFSGADPLDEELMLFRQTYAGAPRYGRGKIGIAGIGNTLTNAQIQSLSRAVVRFEKAIGRRTDNRPIVTFGDSITAGAGPNDGRKPETTYAFQLANALGAPLLNMGIGSSSTSMTAGSPAFKAGVERYTDILSCDPRKVFILYGTNDLGGGVSTSTYSSALNTIIAGLIEGGISANSIIVGSPPYRTPGETYTLSEQRAYADTARAVAATHGARYADIWGAFYSAFLRGITVSSDGVHPNDAGHALLATTFLEAAGEVPRNCIGMLRGADLNAAANSDQTIPMFASRYIIRKIVCANASTSLASTSATVAIRDAASGGGNAVVSSASLSGLTASTKFADQTLFATAGTDALTANPLYFRLGTAHGSAASVDVYVIGDILSV